MSIFSRVIVPVLMVALCLAGPPPRRRADRAGQDQPSEETWNSIKGDIFKDRPILDGSGLVILDAPRRAEDAAIVPIGMRVNFGRRRQAHAAIADARHRRKSRACRRHVHDRASFRRDVDFHARPGQHLFLCSR